MHRYRRYDGVDGPRVAIAHDYLTQRGGAEKVVLSMSRAFPDAPIYTTLFDPANTYPEFAERDVRVSRLNKVGPLRKNHRAALLLLPFAARSMYVDADVVLTSTSGWAHGFRTPGRKLVYCYSPARWLYLRDKYLGEGGGALKRLVLAVSSGILRSWDRQAAMSCDRYLAISSVVQRRIADAYGICADVVPAPVAMSSITRADPVRAVQRWIGASATRGDGADDFNGSFYLCVSRLLPYKNVDKVVRAFASGRRQLVVVGRGPEAEHIRSIQTPNVLVVADLTDGQMGWLYQRCRATIAAGYEDYGLTPIEAAVWGRPSVVLRWGGFLDTVESGVTGIYFDRPEPDAIAGALDRFEDSTFDPDEIRRHVEQFSESRFAETLHAAIEDMMKENIWRPRSLPPSGEPTEEQSGSRC